MNAAPIDNNGQIDWRVLQVYFRPAAERASETKDYVRLRDQRTGLKLWAVTFAMMVAANLAVTIFDGQLPLFNFFAACLSAAAIVVCASILRAIEDAMLGMILRNAVLDWIADRDRDLIHGRTAGMH